MGIYDRDYYRRETHRLPWSTGLAPVVKWLLIVNIAVFVLQMLSPKTTQVTQLRQEDTILEFRSSQPLVDSWLALMPDRVGPPYWEVWRLLTYAFCHGGIWHIVFNMFFLWMFGRELENLYGPKEFLRFYLTAGFVAALGHIALSYSQGRMVPAIGASGAVMGVVILYAMYYPRRQIWVWGILPLEIRWWALIYVGADLLLLNNVSDNVAHAAHLGGAAYGALYKVFDLRWSRLIGGRRAWPRWRWPSLSWRRRPRVRVLVPPEEQDFDRRVDQVLAKIARQGTTSLTDEERRILEEASHLYKRRRS